MRKIRNFAGYVRERWLEATMLFGLAILFIWLGFVAVDFLPSRPPTPSPVLGPTPTLNPTPTAEPTPTRVVLGGSFDGQAAYQHVLAQVGFGPRPTGSYANRQTGDYIIDQLEKAGWRVEVQEFTYQGTAARNIIGRTGDGPVAIIGAHYDTRREADNDPSLDRRDEPVLGANDGASGVAVLLELARSLKKDALAHEVWLTFFDAEDNGRLDGWDFIAGSRHMAENLTVTPDFVVVVDMVGDRDQQLYLERNSTPELQSRIWSLAEELRYEEYFIREYKWAILDDHTPFLELGIPAVDIIDFDYDYWHTTADTADKVSPQSLERVGVVVKALMETWPAD